MVGLLGSMGCQTAMLAASAVQGPPKVDAKFTLPAKPTAIVVDDPRDLLDNPAIARQIGTTAMHYLRINEVLLPEMLIASREVTRLENMAGRQWSMLPIDEIGRRVGAEQVIYVKVLRVAFKTDEQLYRPEVTLETKVISCVDGSRLWPEPPPLADRENSAPGHTLTVKLDYETRASRYADDATPADLARRLADESGLAVARLFYRWAVDPVGSNL